MFSESEWNKIVEAIRNEARFGVRIIFQTKEGHVTIEQNWEERMIKEGFTINGLRNHWSPTLSYGVLEILLENGITVLHFMAGDENRLIHISSIGEKEELDISYILDTFPAGNICDPVLRVFSYETKNRYK